MDSGNSGTKNKTDLMRELKLNQKQLDKILEDSWEDLPVGKNVLNSRNIYNDDTIKYIEKNYNW